MHYINSCQLQFGGTRSATTAERTLGGGEVDDVAVALEHVHLLNCLDGLDIELLEGLLELLVIASGPGGGALNLSPGSALATIRGSKVRVFGSTRLSMSSSISLFGSDLYVP
jgi:hypothetical protein